ncbi:MAG: twin-arginine translocase subunit TatC, partial [Bacteroidota bacterium]
VITPDILKAYRRHAIVILLLMAAVITPPDIMSQVLIFIPLFLLYEVSVRIVKRVHKKREKELAASLGPSVTS